MSKRHHFALPAALAVAGLLAACGGGSDGLGAVADTVPASATASPEAFTEYAAALPENDRREPLRLDGLVPPTSETAEPVPVVR
jgi:hypothetical protein